MADEKNRVWICCYSKRIQRLPQNMLNSRHPFSNNTAWGFLGKLLYSKVARSRTHGPGKTAISHLAKALVINFWPKQDAKKARRWMMKPRPVISEGRMINSSRTLKAPRPDFNRMNVFGILKISTSVTQLYCEPNVQLLPPLSDRQLKSSTATTQQGFQCPLVEPLFQLQISEPKFINHYEIWV